MEKDCWERFEAIRHTKKTCHPKNGGFSETSAELKLEYMEFITNMKLENRFGHRPANIRSIDVNNTSKPPTKITTFSRQFESRFEG